MQSSKRATDVLVGAFVVIGVAIILAASLWAREANLGRDGASITARYRDIGGAGVGTNAYIRGVRVGRVGTIQLGDDGWVRVHFLLESSASLPPDPVIILGAASLVGDWQATIITREAAPDDSTVRRQLAEAAGEPGVVAGATLPDLRAFTARGSRILEDVGYVAAEAHLAFDDGAAREVRASIANSRAFSANLLAMSEAAKRVAQRLDAVSAGDALPRTAEDVTAAAADLRLAAAELRSLMARDGDARTTLDRVLARADTFAARATTDNGTVGRMLSDASLYNAADSLLVELRALVADLKAHPKRYFTIRVF